MQRERFKLLISSHCSIFASIVGATAFLVAFLLNVWYCTFSSFIMILCGIFLYVIFVRKNKDIFNNQAIFSGVWFCSIGLALLRLNLNQVPWAKKTWACLFIAYVAFLFGYSILNTRKNHYISSVNEIKQPSFFLLIILNFIVAVIAFISEVVILGYIPAFSNDQTAYVAFYVRGVHYFTVSIILFVPLCILYLKKFASMTSKLKIILLALCSVIAFAIPVLIVSRQIALLQIVLCIFALYYNENKATRKNFLAIAVVIAIGLSNWVIISNLRNQNNEYLREVFDAPSVTQEAPLEKEEEKESEASFSNNVAEWPMCIYHPYMYISFNFDNFNYSVSRIDRCAKGIYSLHPIVHMSPLIRLYNEYPMYVYNKIYNTFPIIYPPYYDFGIIGIVIYMVLIGLLARFSAMWDKKDPFLQMVSYLIKFALMFSFFASFFANTAFLFYIVLLLIMAFANNWFNKLQTHKK